MKRFLIPALLFTFAALASLACGGDDDATSSAADGIEEVTRQVLQGQEAAGVTDQLLELTRVIIPAGDEIAPHTHPGTQLAIIVEGTLTYSVLRGEAVVTHEAGTPRERKETVGAGRTVELRPGASVSEPPGMAHMARNRGDEAVVLYTASLFPEGAPASSPAQ